MPSTLPSSLSYYQQKGRNNDKDSDDSVSMSIPEKVQVMETESDMGRGAGLEHVGDGGVHAIGETFV